MANLIALQNQLKGLRDEDLDREIEQPTGTVPVFLVASEKQRREQMRQAYEGEKARQEEGKTTVLEDLMAARGMGQPGAQTAGAPGGPLPPGPMGAPAGIDSVVPGFANGGLIDYSSISTGYGGLAEQMAANREQNKWLALAQLGAGIAGGTSPSFATNVGQGSAAGLSTFQQNMANETSDQLQLLNAQLGLLTAQERSDLAQSQFTFEQEQAARQGLMDERRLEIQERQASEGPAAVETYKYFQGLTPDEQAKFLRIQESRRGPTDYTQFNAASTAYRRAQEYAEEKVANEPEFIPIRLNSNATPELKAKYEARVRQETNRRFTDFYPQFVEFLPQFGQGSTNTSTTAPTSGIKFIEGLPEGATVKDLTTPIMRGSTPKEQRPSVTVPETFTYSQ